MDISSQEIESIVRKVLSGIEQNGRAEAVSAQPAARQTVSYSSAAPAVSKDGDYGVFDKIEDAIEAANKA